ncbi:gluconokinase [Isoptericola sp. NPDC056573]|uniref:gluconokinase n=1 Tax=Isoptericola sp. NPDC056573 TaxID=3345868 RepID=UPI00367ABDE7
MAGAVPGDVRGVVVMGVAGCGKSTVGWLLAARLGLQFVDADDLHPPSNVAKMSAGTPLTDDDRRPWLARVAEVLRGGDDGAPAVVACSALRRSYRDILRAGAGGDVAFVHLHGDRDLLARRIAARADHFMPPALLDSQLATLEPLGSDETGVMVDVDQTVDRAVDVVAGWFSRPGVP